MTPAEERRWEAWLMENRIRPAHHLSPWHVPEDFDPVLADHIHRAYERGWSLQRIADRLNERRVRPPQRAAQWNAERVRAVLAVERVG